MLYSIKYAEVKGSTEGARCGRGNLKKHSKQMRCAQCQAVTYYQIEHEDYGYNPMCSDQCWKLYKSEQEEDIW